MNRTIKDEERRSSSVKRYHDGSHEQLRAHLHLFVEAYDDARRLKTLRGLTTLRVRVQGLDPTAR